MSYSKFMEYFQKQLFPSVHYHLDDNQNCIWYVFILIIITLILIATHTKTTLSFNGGL